MPTVVVRNNAGSRFDPLAERLTAIAEETLPLVEAVTELPLPDTVAIRLMSPRAWRKAHSRRAQRLVITEGRELGVSFADLRQVAGALKAERKGLRQIWPLIGAQSVLFTRGQPEIVVMPRALWEMGVLNDEEFHYKTVAHEMVHLAQYAVTDGQVWAANDSLFPQFRGIADRDYGFLLEGHAYWADRQITAKLLGAPVQRSGISPHASLRYQALAKSRAHKDSSGYVKRAEASVDSIVAEHGLTAFNRIWVDRTDLVPLRKETDEPTAWQARFSAPRSA
ncbi:hypothetical protein [Streptomyces sp. NPDC001401]|uniref:hypothetical protein n=1 Tax=Streptomyces sp. NPDC001401 TaxID=3364570 RepID=UPI003691AB4C